MKRWLVLTLGLGVAAVAGLSLLTGGDIGGSATRESPKHDDVQHATIDQESRDQLRAILREADGDEVNSP